MERLNDEIDSYKEQLSEPDKVLVSNDELTQSYNLRGVMFLFGLQCGLTT